MRKMATAIGAVILSTGTWVVASGPDQYSAEARAYVNYAFGAPATRALKQANLHYGLRLDAVQVAGYSNFITPLREDAQPRSLLQFEGSSRGDAIAALNGVPFAAHFTGLNQDDSGGGAPTTEGGFTWFDWGLLAVGVGGVGYAIARAAKGSDSPDPAPSGGSSGGSSGGGLTSGGLTSGGLTSGGSSGGSSGGLTSGGLTSGGLTSGGWTRVNADAFNNPDPAYQRWLDGGTGHMGDLATGN